MANTGWYCIETFYRERGVTKGNPLLTTIFNVVVDAVVCHWEFLMAEGDGGDERDDRSGDKAAQLARWMIRARMYGRRRTEEGVKVWEAILYAGNRMVASTNSGWLQIAFYMMTGLFDWVGLKTNIRKTVGMVCHPCR